MKIQIFVNYLKETAFKNETFGLPNIIHFFSVYKVDTQSQDLNSDFTLNDWLFGSAKLVKNSYPD